MLVVEVLNNKSTYNTLELTSGRMAKVARGRCRGRRARPSQGAVRLLRPHPATLKPGDVIQMLNIGGVLGVCDSATPDKGKPFDCKVLGAVLTFPYLGERIGVTARTGYKPLDYQAPARCARRARGRARRHVHGGRQDRGGLRHHRAHAPPRPHRRCLQGHRRLPAARHPGIRGFGRPAHHDLHRPRRRHDHGALRSGAHPHHADRDGGRARPT